MLNAKGGGGAGVACQVHGVHGEREVDGLFVIGRAVIPVQIDVTCARADRSAWKVEVRGRLARGHFEGVAHVIRGRLVVAGADLQGNAPQVVAARGRLGAGAVVGVRVFAAADVAEAELWGGRGDGVGGLGLRIEGMGWLWRQAARQRGLRRPSRGQRGHGRQDGQGWTSTRGMRGAGHR